MLEQRVIVGEYQRWIAKLLGHNFQLEYKKGMDNSTTDALSQLSTVLELGVISVLKGLNMAVFNEQVEAYLMLRDIRQLLLTGQQAPKGYTLKGDV